MKYKKRGVYLKLYASYILILLLPLLVGAIVYSQTLKVSQGQAKRLNSSLMQIVRNECDNQVSEAVRNLNRIAFDTRVQTLSNVKGSFGPEDQYNMYQVYADLKNSNFTAQYYDDVFVYFKNMDTVVSTSGKMSLDMFYHLYYENETFPLQTDLKSFLFQHHYQDITPVYKKDGSHDVLFTLTSLYSNLGETSATLGIRMGAEVLDKRIESVKWNDEMEFLILDSQNRVINTIDEALAANQMLYDNLETGLETQYDYKGQKYTVLAVDSQTAQWKYVLLLPTHIIEQNAREIQRYCVIGLFLCIFIGFLISYYLTNKNYNPLKALMDLFRLQQKNDSLSMAPVNEYQWLEMQVQNFFREHKNMKHDLTMNQKVLRQYYLFRLLEYPLEETGPAVETYTAKLTDSHSLVLLISIEGRENSEEEAGLQRFIAANITGETLGEHFNAELVEIGEIVAAIISLPGAQENHLDSIGECIENVQKMIKEQFHFNIVVLVGEIHRGLEGIHTSYQEAREAEEYISLLDAETIFYRDIKNANKKYNYPMEVENKIINAIKAGNSKSTAELIDKVLEVNYSENKISSKVLKCLLYDMLGTLMKAADEIGCSSFFEQENINFQISVKKTLEELKEQFRDTTELLCIESERLKDSGGSELSEKVMEYIQTEYKNPDLNISQTGFHFDMTPAYLSAMFKKQTGKSLLKYINTVRIEAAEELLMAGASVVETSLSVGFRDSRTFIRVFKEYRGITPGQMKKMQSD